MQVDKDKGPLANLIGSWSDSTGESFTELVVQMEHIAGTHDIAFADFNRGRMVHRPSRFGGGTALYPFTAQKGERAEAASRNRVR